MDLGNLGILSNDTFSRPEPAKLVFLVTALVRSHCISKQAYKRKVSLHTSPEAKSVEVAGRTLTLVKKTLRTLAGSLAIAKVDANYLVLCGERVLGTLFGELFVLQLRLVRVVRHGTHRCDALQVVKNRSKACQ